MVIRIEKPTLTLTERMYLDMLANGDSYKHVAIKAKKSIRTIQFEMERCRAKFGAKNITHLFCILIKEKHIEL